MVQEFPIGTKPYVVGDRVMMIESANLIPHHWNQIGTITQAETCPGEGGVFLVVKDSGGSCVCYGREIRLIEICPMK